MALYEAMVAAPTTLVVTWSRKSKMSARAPSKRSAHKCAPVEPSLDRELPQGNRNGRNSTPPVDVGSHREPGVEWIAYLCLVRSRTRL